MVFVVPISLDKVESFGSLLIFNKRFSERKRSRGATQLKKGVLPMYTENSLFVCSVNEPEFLWYVWNYNCYK